MTAQEFIEKWGPGGANFAMTEKAGAQQHFLELCTLLGVDSPNDAEHYTFEKGTLKLGEARGFADVFKRGAFAWENKGPNADLKGALKQLKMYASALDNPPLLVVSDRLVIEVHTQFTGTPTEVHRFTLKDLADPARVSVLRKVWLQPEAFKPKRTSRDITEAAAKAFADVANRMRDERKESPERVAHFLTQCVFCFFAEDVELLPEKLFDQLVNKFGTPERLKPKLAELFEQMRDGGSFGLADIPYFNGGLFRTIDIPNLTPMDVAALRSASALNWSAIDVAIVGTLFERGLDPDKRSYLGAHYTDPSTIMRIVTPVVVRPLEAEWEAVKKKLATASKTRKDGRDPPTKSAKNIFIAWLQRLEKYRVLDPACGSGNFLYLALKALKDLEHRSYTEALPFGIQREVTMVTGPHNVTGIEINDYAAELARISIWIGEIQWNLAHGLEQEKNPVLKELNHIENKDAILTTFPQPPSGENDDEGEVLEGIRTGELAATCVWWPKADAIIGNPPFLGGSKKRRELGDDYFDALNLIYARKVPGAADLVCYWFEKARDIVWANERPVHVGLVATNSIRGGANRKVLDAIVDEAEIYEAWSDEPWINDGAAVRVSLICFAGKKLVLQMGARSLNGVPAAQISADLTADSGSGANNLTIAKTLDENESASYQGASKKAKFEIQAVDARRWLELPNPNGKSNAEVLKPWANGFELSRRPQDQWIIDFGIQLSEADSALFEAPFRYLTQVVKPEREKNNREAYRKFWWRFAEPRPGLRKALTPLMRYIGTIAHSKFRFFVWLPITTSPDQALITVTRADDTTFGILHSRFHELWSLRLGTSLEDRPRYTPTTCFETFPFPAGLTPRDTAHQRTEALPDGALIPAEISSEKLKHCAAGIASAASHLNELRERWLNPPEWTVRVPEVIPLGMETSPYPDRILPKPNLDEKSLAELKKRTLTNLYNARPAWLDNAHKALDAAVATAYGWADYTSAMTDDEILSRLLALNLARAKAQ
jgi:hypothetical protein